jgi:hypothetical protein
MGIVGHSQHFGKWVRKRGGGTTSLVMAAILLTTVFSARKQKQTVKLPTSVFFCFYLFTCYFASFHPSYQLQMTPHLPIHFYSLIFASVTLCYSTVYAQCTENIGLDEYIFKKSIFQDYNVDCFFIKNVKIFFYK